MGKGGGSPAPQPSSQTVTNTSIPEYARPYVENMLGKSEALTDINKNPYQTYGGERLAGFTPLQQQAFNNAANMTTSGATGMGIGLAGLAGGQAMGAGNQYMRMATDPYAQSAFMSPYMQNVVDLQKQEAIRDYQKAMPGLQAQAVRQGAFGGSRSAIQQAEASRALGQNLAQIQATGTQSAYDQAMKNMQFGSNLGLQGLQTGLQGATALGGLGQQQFQQGVDLNKLQQAAGATQQTAQQQKLDLAQQDFLKQQNYPYQQLAFMSDMLRGLPLSQTAQSVYSAPPSLTSQLAGVGTTLGAAYLMGKKEGGIIDGYKAGGSVQGYNTGGIAAGMPQPAQPSMSQSVAARVTQEMNPQELAKKLDYVDASYLERLIKDPNVDPMTKALAQKELDSRPGAEPQVNPATAGLPALNTGDMYAGMDVQGAAGGGIIAFAGDETSVVPKPAFDPYEDYVAARDKLRKQSEKAEFSQNAALGRALLPVGQALMMGKRTGGGGLSDILAGAAPGITKGAEMYVAEKGAANKAQLSAAEKEAELSAGLYKSDLATKAALAKPTDMRQYINDFVKAARARGDKETPDEVLRNQGANKYLELQGAAGARGYAAVLGAETNVTKAQTDLFDKARDNIDNMLNKNYNSPENRELRKLQKEDKINGTNKAKEYKDGLIAKEEQRLKGANKPETPKPGATSDTPSKGAPDINTIKGAPAGSKIGKSVPGQGYEILDKNGKLIGYAN
jgi:hypothetical protein